MKPFQTHFPHNPKDEYPEARALKRKVYLHLGQTNTGKTYQAISTIKTKYKWNLFSALKNFSVRDFLSV